jgi:hypothetical protein
MGEGKINLDSFLDDKIKRSLLKQTSDDFIEKLEREIELSREFAKEDVKEKKLVKYVISVFLILFISFGTTIAFYFGQRAEVKLFEFEGVIDTITSQISILCLKIFEIFGLSVSDNSFIYIFVFMLIVILYTVVDRLLIKKRLRKTTN